MRVDRRVFGLLFLGKEEEARLKAFLNLELNIPEACLNKNYHITVYEARIELPGLNPLQRSVSVQVPASMWRFMVMAPGGENERPEINPDERQIGLRLHRSADAYSRVSELRANFFRLEAAAGVPKRNRSTLRLSAFGARNYQPHMTICQPGHGLGRNLSPHGEALRAGLGDLHFDRFEVRVFDTPSSDSLGR